MVIAGLGLMMLLTQSTKLATKVLEVTMPVATTLNPEMVHVEGVKGVPPFTETEQVTEESV